MLKLLIEKELKGIIGSPKFIMMFAISSILILLTFYVGGINYKKNLAQHEAAKLENLRSMEGIKDWRMIEHNIYLPPSILASLVNGISNDIGRNVDMYGRGEIRPHGSKYNENPVYAAFRFLDLTFLFQIVLSLFAILFTYDAVNGEKENGTLRLIFSNSIPREKYILGKILGSYAALSIPLIIPLLLGCLVLPILGIHLNGSEWFRLALIINAGFLFMGVFITLSVFISSVSKRSANSFLLLLVIWLFVILVIPRAAVLISGRLVDVPPIDELNSKKNAYNRELAETVLDKLKAFKADGNENLFAQFEKYMEEVNDDRDEKMNSFGAKLDEERKNRQNVQSNLSLTFARISPAAQFSLASSCIAGTSLTLSQEFLDQAKNYQNVFKSFQQAKSGGSSGGRMQMIMVNEGEEPPDIDPTELPEFVYKEANLDSIIVASLGDFGLLIIYTFIFFAGAYMAFRRFDLR
jgi:ABC-2 type transport system permease protein